MILQESVIINIKGLIVVNPAKKHEKVRLCRV